MHSAPAGALPAGEQFLGVNVINAAASANAPFSVPLSVRLTNGRVGAEAATDSVGNTSEFSAGIVVAPPVLSIGDVTGTEVNGSTVNAAFIVSLSPTSLHTVTVDFSTADGTANAPAEYRSASGTLTFATAARTR